MKSNLSKKECSLIKRAYSISKKSTHQFKLGCVVYNKKLQSVGMSLGHKTHPNLDGKVNKLHAEMVAIKYSNTDLSGSCMIIVRGSIDKPLLAKPCSLCMEQITKTGIKKVIYSTEDGFEVLEL